MKIGIVGSTGYISSFLIKKLKDISIKEIIEIDKFNEKTEFFLDLEHAENFDYELLNDLDYIVFTAAVSGPDACANEYEKCWKINVEGTEYFIKKAIERKCKVIFFSSDAVFGDIPGEIYTEESSTNAKTAYGIMKKKIEDEFKNEECFKAIRLSYVVSARDRFVSYCCNCMKESKVAEVFHPFYRNCISVSDVVSVVIWLINNWSSYKSWVLNVAGKELVSRVRIADELNTMYENKLKYSIISPEEDFYKNRPRITHMDSLYLDKYDILKDESFSEKIKREMEGIDL